MQDSILKGKLQPMVGRPGDTLQPEDFAKVKKEMEEEFKTSVTDYDMNAFLMYPAVFRGYMKHVNKAGTLTRYLPSRAFFYGLEPLEKIDFEIPGANVADAEKEFNAEAATTNFEITLLRVGPLE